MVSIASCYFLLNVVYFQDSLGGCVLSCETLLFSFECCWFAHAKDRFATVVKSCYFLLNVVCESRVPWSRAVEEICLAIFF